MNTEKITSKTLMISILMGFILIVIGEMVKMTGNGESLLSFGILFLILSPLMAVVVATISFYVNKEREWVIVALILISICIGGILVAICILRF